MLQFQYTARNTAGGRVAGRLEAENQVAAQRLLEERDLFPVDVWDAEPDRYTSKRRRISSSDLGVMYGQLSDLLGSGVPLLRALDSLVRSTVNRRLSAILRNLHDEVADGKSLHEAMRGHSGVFPLLHTVMVQAGERASFLEEVLASLSVFLERLDELRAKVLGALIYPTMLCLLGSGVMLAALVFFVPKFEPMLADIPKKPLPTEILLLLSIAVREQWLLLVAGLGGLIAMGFGIFKSNAGRKAFEKWQLKIPVAGNAMRMVAITRFCRILGTMLKNGVPILKALAISRDATGSVLMAERIDEAIENVRAGESLSSPLKVGGLFPPQVIAMITVAEESNQLQKVLLHIADSVEKRTNQQVDQAVRLIEPVVLCLVAAAIGFLALGLLLPIFTMASSLHSP